MQTVKSNNSAKYVDLAVECSRTRVQFPPPPPILKVPTLIGWDFFCLFPRENGNDVASVASAAARFSARFRQIPLSVISRDASARDATSSINKGLQAAGSISNLVGRWGIGKKWHGVRLTYWVWAQRRDVVTELDYSFKDSCRGPLAACRLP